MILPYSLCYTCVGPLKCPASIRVLHGSLNGIVEVMEGSVPVILAVTLACVHGTGVMPSISLDMLYCMKNGNKKAHSFLFFKHGGGGVGFL